MPKTVLALYDSQDAAEAATRALTGDGFDRDNISMVIRDPGETHQEVKPS